MVTTLSKSDIDYLDKVANSTYGCKHGCPYCYGKDMENRLKCRGTIPQDWTWEQPFNTPERIAIQMHKVPKTFRSKNPNLPVGEAMVGINFLGDGFGAWQSTEYIYQVTTTIPDFNQFLFLTKNPERYFQGGPYKPNCWLGVTVTGNEDKRMSRLLLDRTKYPRVFGASKVWMSVEPLLTKPTNRILHQMRSMDWVVVGACTGKRPFQPEFPWLEDIIDECRDAGVPVFLKRNIKHPIASETKNFPRMIA